MSILAAPIDIGDYNPAGVAVDASHLYWSDTGEPSVRQGAIWEANLDGTSPHAVLPNQRLPFGVTVSASQLQLGERSCHGTINQANLDGSSAQAIVTGQNSPVRGGGGQPPVLD